MPPPPPPPGPPPSAPKAPVAANDESSSEEDSEYDSSSSEESGVEASSTQAVESQPSNEQVKDDALHATLVNIERIPIKNTLLIINSFVVNTVDFVNKFGALCERKLNKISYSVQRLDVVLNILEGKLDSVAWLAGEGEAPPAPAPSAPADSKQPVDNNAPASADGSAAPPPDGPPEPAKPSGKTVSQDSRYKKFFLMLDKGVPKAALGPRMTMEGLDPEFLDTPDAPAPPGGDDGLGDVDDDSSDPPSDDMYESD